MRMQLSHEHSGGWFVPTPLSSLQMLLPALSIKAFWMALALVGLLLLRLITIWAAHSAPHWPCMLPMPNPKGAPMRFRVSSGSASWLA